VAKPEPINEVAEQQEQKQLRSADDNARQQFPA
jgi:hypothetical protein